MEIAYLIKNALGIYQFRRFVPAPLIPIIGKKEIRRTLGTRCINIAKKRCVAYTAECNAFFDYVQQYLAAMSRRKRQPNLFNPHDVPVKITFGELSFDKNGFNLKNVSYDPDKPIAGEIKAYVETARELARLSQELSGSVPETSPPQSDRSTPQSAISSPVQTVDSAQSSALAHDTSIFSVNSLYSEIVEAFVADRVKNVWNSPGSRLGHQNTAETFIRILGDRPILNYTRADSEKFRKVLAQIPVNWFKLKEYKNLTVEESIAFKEKLGRPSIAPKTILEHLGRVRAVWAFCEARGLSVSRIFSDLHIRNESSTSYEPFSMEHLKNIFARDNYLSFQKRNYPSRYWVPLIALHTGARLGEICFLTPGDIIFKDELGWAIDINKDETNYLKKSLKTIPSARVIPIHSKLIEIGFLDFVDACRKRSKTERVFSDYGISSRGQAGNKLGDAFGEYLTRLGYPRERKYVFHSFRHTVISTLENLLNDEYIIQRIVGHEAKTITRKVYHHKSFPIDLLKPVIEQLDFSEALKDLPSFNER